MCNQRDRLIGYLYSEGTAAEREEVQRHLDTCVECRTEIAGLRSVREDLLAWEVPEHESVWRPFAPAPVTPWWRQVPTWAMAAAASVVLVSGAAGGAVAHAFLPDPVQAVADRAVGAALVPAGVSIADLTAAEQRWLAQLRTEVGAVNAQVQKASTRTSLGPLAEADHDALETEVLVLRSDNKKLAEVVNRIYTNLDGLHLAAEAKNGEFETRLSNLQAIVQQLVQAGK